MSFLSITFWFRTKNGSCRHLFCTIYLTGCTRISNRKKWKTISLSLGFTHFLGSVSLFSHHVITCGLIIFIEVSPSLWVHYLCSNVIHPLGSMSLSNCHVTFLWANHFIKVPLSLPMCSLSLFRFVSSSLWAKFCSTFIRSLEIYTL